MRITFTFIIKLLIFNYLQTQSLFQAYFGGMMGEGLRSIEQIDENFYILGGFSRSFEPNSDFMVSIMDSTGQINNTWTIGTDAREGLDGFVNRKAAPLSQLPDLLRIEPSPSLPVPHHQEKNKTKKNR